MSVQIEDIRNCQWTTSFLLQFVFNQAPEVLDNYQIKIFTDDLTELTETELYWAGLFNIDIIYSSQKSIRWRKTG